MTKGQPRKTDPLILLFPQQKYLKAMLSKLYAHTLSVRQILTDFASKTKPLSKKK